MSEESHSPVPSKRNYAKEMPFPDAMKQIMGGKKIRRIEWAEESEHGVLRESFLMIYRNNKYHTWILSEGDILAIDWVVIK